MNKRFNLLIDTKRTGFNTVRGLKEGDNNSVLNITLVQNSIPFDLTGLTVRINYKRPDNKLFLQMVDVINPTEGEIKVNILTKVLETVGEVKADLSIFDKDNRKITSVTFNMFVDASIYRNDYIEPEDLDLIQSVYTEEEKRIRQEKAREKNEDIRKENEIAREIEENKRVKTEKIRQENENKRVESENIRADTESIRKSNETNRDEAEKIRQVNEKTRLENEKAREKNETKRIESENKRETQEVARQQGYTNMKNTIDSFDICEEYNPKKEYKKYNRVTFNGSSYESLKDSKGIDPTNTEHWICIAKKGKDGDGTGDMLKEVYDKNNNGIVDRAEVADSVEWSGIKNKPLTDKELENTKGTISAKSDTGEVTTPHDRQVNCSYRCKSAGSHTVISSSIASSANRNRSFIVNSSSCSTDFEASAIISSSKCITNGKSIIVASECVKDDGLQTIVGGYGYGEPSTKNKKWEISSYSGTIKATGAITGNSTFADFAEYFESTNGKAIPTGIIVTLDGDKIRPCRQGEEMLGVISETAGVLLNACGFHWQDRYLKNEFGGLVYEKKYDEETKQYIKVFKENLEHDMKEEYIAREDREEWNVVGLTGQVYVRIDETVVTGDFIKSDNLGRATKDDNPTYTRWRVMEVTTEYSDSKGYGVALVFIK
ncbi:pre-neck appendage protein (endogenous virus) [Clostridium phage phiCT19406C]|uniref:pre-neck appendage protein n=4 Tax=root TaxID=1 RepID=UPI000572A893|nr:pre-neck appendage protein [Clostridium phage phiCT19406C]AJA42876.1 pre-neck appendage-like protein [Clostridium phage phiCT19406C]